MHTQHYALVTGASSGIGKAIAYEFARKKKNLVLIALPHTGLKEVVKDLCENYCLNVHAFEVDLTAPKAPEIVFNWCINYNITIDILVNNAGIGNIGAFENTPTDTICTMINLNAKALVMLSHQFIPMMKKNKRSFLLNVGSLASFMPVPNKSVYAATKSFVYAFSYALRLELQPYSISVSCLCPGGTSTSPEAREIIEKLNANSAFIQKPEEVARVAVQELLNGTFRIIPGWHNRVAYYLSQWLPEAGVCWIVQRVFNRKQAGIHSSRLNHSRMTTHPQIQ
jgi:uncharacterized protein